MLFMISFFFVLHAINAFKVSDKFFKERVIVIAANKQYLFFIFIEYKKT